MTLIAVAAGRRREDESDPWPLPEPFTPTVKPTPYTDQTTVHPSVVDMVAETGQPLSGYRWWMADTPFPNGDISLENPFIYRSNDRINWQEPVPGINPLVPPPAENFNADTELVWDADGQRLVLFWRYFTTMPTATSTDGLTWVIQETPADTGIGPPTTSPAIVQVGPSQWRMWRFDDDHPYFAMFTASDPFGPWTFAEQCTRTGPGATDDIWHGDVILHEGIYRAIWSSRSAVHLASSPNGYTWTVSGPLTWDTYRPTMLPSTLAGWFDIWGGDFYTRLPETDWPTPL